MTTTKLNVGDRVERIGLDNDMGGGRGFKVGTVGTVVAVDTHAPGWVDVDVDGVGVIEANDPHFLRRINPPEPADPTLRRPQSDRANVTMSLGEASALLHGDLTFTEKFHLALKLDRIRRDYVESTLGVRHGKRVWLTLTDGREFDGVLRRGWSSQQWSITDGCDNCGWGGGEVVHFSPNEVAEVCTGPWPAFEVRTLVPAEPKVGDLVRRTKDNGRRRLAKGLVGRVQEVRRLSHQHSMLVVGLDDGDALPVVWDAANVEVVA